MMPHTVSNAISTSRRRTGIAMLVAVSLGAASSAAAHGPDSGGIVAEASEGVHASFDIVHARISIENNIATFHMGVSGAAGTSRPTPTGALAGSRAFSYVWPTSIDPYAVGFEREAGILALAVAAHPDFDDTPLFDENGDGNPNNDGNVWHSHWAVLGPDDACGPDALKVIDIPEGAKPRLPKTWPGLPVLLDSPGWDPLIEGDTIEVKVPFDDAAAVRTATFDGVTSGLRVNENMHAPLLCIDDVFDVASGDLSLPGTVNQ